MVEILPRLTAALADRYRIERELGAGGMAIVFLAEDLRHHRKVAVKVLRPELAAILGGARFLKEIQLTANLQHPHILSLFDSGEADGVVWYVMPFVDGESLRDRLTREKQLPVEEALRIAREVADALEYAHRQSIVHRDIKPENILLHGGHAQVADFGIALAASRSEGGTRMTETGMSLGTPQYMAPEQAMGEREITPRADVYALGCVLYEMLAGEPPFTGPTAQSIVAKVMTEEPRRLTLQRRTVPPNVEAAVEVALAKLPADRFGSAAEFAAALSGEGPRTAVRPRVAGRPAPDQWKRAAMALGVAALALAALAVWGFARSGRPSVYDVGLADSAAMAFRDPLTSFAVSPDAGFMIYTARLGDSATQLAYRSLRDLGSHALAGTVGAGVPRVSPDGARVAFVQGGKLAVMPVDGGTPRALADVRAVRTVEWVSPTRLLVVDDDGSTLRWIDADAGQVSVSRIPYCVGGTWLAGSQRLLCGGGATKSATLLDPASGHIVPIEAPAEGGTEHAGVPLAGSAFRVVDGAWLVYVSLDGDIRATSFDARAARAGRSVTLVPGVRREAYTGEGQLALTPGGTLVYAPGPNAEIGRLVRARARGAPEPLPIEAAAFLRWDLSPDGRWLAAAVQGLGRQELRLYDLRDGSRQTWAAGYFVGQPLWSPSGQRLMADIGDSVRASVIVGVPWSPAPPETLLTMRGRGLEPFTPMAWYAEHLVLANLWEPSIIVRFDPASRPVRVDTLLRGAIFPALSPDGRTLAYESAERGEVLASPYPALDRRIQLASRGTEPQWLSSSDVLVRRDPTWFRVRVSPGARDVTGAAEPWLTDPRFADTPGWSNRVTREGSLLYLEGPEQTRAAFVRVVPGWVARMKRAVRAANR